MVSVSDRETQYFIAESTKTLHLHTQTADNPMDALWAGCISVPKAGRLCEYTIATAASKDPTPCFEVNDLEKDPRFNTLPFVTGGPKFRYYVGVPITTDMGIAIGSLFAMDTRPRERISASNKQLMVTMARNVMIHLEMLREREDRKRATDMYVSLSAFTDPTHNSRTRRQKVSAPPGRNTESGGAELDVKPGNNASIASNGPRDLRDHGVGVGSSDDSGTTDSNTTAPIAEDEAHRNLFKRAAGLLFDSLSLDEGGGVVFLDDTSEEIPVTQRDRNVDSLPSPFEDDRQSHVLASTTSDNGDHYTTRSSASVSGIQAADLARLIMRYPRGKLISLDPDTDPHSSSSGDELGSPSTQGRPRHHKQLKMADVRVLQSYLPTARQVVFVPIWDAVSDCWSACVLYNCSEYRTITTAEFLYCIAFCNSIGGEISKLAALTANKQKHAFIGTMSHELRSPLHGILGSMELLDGTSCTKFQRSLVDTTRSCASSLLEMVQQILDFSKIAGHERQINPDYSLNNEDTAKSNLQGELPLEKLESCNLAGVVEETVNGVTAGRTSLSKNSAEMHNPQDEAYAPQDEDPHDVEVVLDIDRRNSWVCETRVGAIRRIIMNLFGNSLKNTQRGFIKISLKAAESLQSIGQKEGTDSTIVTLSVEDTGCGMSQQFMRSKLFVPFSQENTLAPGTGLGLSLVKQLVKSLDGEIRVNSTVGLGTNVVVRLPLRIVHIAAETSGLTSSVPEEDVIHALRRVTVGKKVVLSGRLHPQSCASWSASSDQLYNSLVSYLVDWYGFTAVTSPNNGEDADLVPVDEEDLSAIAFPRPATCLLIVLCTPKSRHGLTELHAGRRNIEFISKPIGPYNLAKAILQGLESIKAESRDEWTESPPSIAEAHMASNTCVRMEPEAINATKDYDIQQSTSAMQGLSMGDLSRPAAHVDVDLTAANSTHATGDRNTPQKSVSRAPHILLVDDNIVNLRLLNAFMQKRAHESIDLAQNGEEAVSMFQDRATRPSSQPHDIIFMDLNMPVLDGFAATRKIRQIEQELARTMLLERKTPFSPVLIIALTGLAGEKDRSKAFGSGIDKFMTKPVRFRELGLLLDKWAGN